MKIAKCGNNHIYDSDMYPVCPYCTPQDPTPPSPPEPQPPVDRPKVVGWIVCTSGSMAGKSCDLYDKQNSVGRGRHTDACFEEDMTISEKHALIAYDGRHNRFYLVPKTETNVMTLNGESVTRTTPLTTFDKIQMGKSSFLFIALCGEKFNWESAGEKNDSDTGNGEDTGKDAGKEAGKEAGKDSNEEERKPDGNGE